MEERQKYVGFFKRFLASLIDFVVLLVPSLFLEIFMAGPGGILPSIGCFWLYYALMESGKWQGTVGKHAMKIVVVDKKGNRISFGRATGRYFSKILSSLILFIGYIMVAFDGNKQGLHDKIAGTFVCYKEVIESEKAPTICPRCQYENQEGTAYCIKCGERLRAPGPICPTCGKNYPLGTQYCPDCGTRLDVLGQDASYL